MPMNNENCFLSLQNILSSLLVVLLVFFFCVFFSENPEWAGERFGESQKFEILKFLGACMGGILLALSR